MSGGEKDAAFDAVYAELFDDVYAYFNLCFGAQAAEDLAQEVFLRVWKAVDGGKIPDNWRAWVFRCAVNLKNDFLRRKYAENNVQEQTILESAPAPTQTDDPERLAVGQALAALSAEARELLTLKSFGFTSEEIGGLLGISASAVRTRLQKAKQNFAENLQKEESSNA